MNIITWIRSKLFGSKGNNLSSFEITHYAKFEQAINESDVEAYVYDEHIHGQVIVLKGEDLHAVTEKNLVSFRKLKRSERRYLDKKFKAYKARPNNENNKHLLRQQDRGGGSRV